MDPRIGVAAGILSGLLAVFGSLLVYYCALVKLGYGPHDLTPSIDDPHPAFGEPEEFRLVAFESEFRVHPGDRVHVEFALCNFSNRTAYLPLERFFMQHQRSRRGGHPSCVVEVRDGDGKLQDFVGRYEYCGVAGALTAGGFYTLKPGNTIPIRHPMQHWKPRAPGIYTFRMALDTRGEIPDAWNRLLGPVEPKALPKLRQMPQGVFVSNPLTIVVEP